MVTTRTKIQGHDCVQLDKIESLQTKVSAIETSCIYINKQLDQITKSQKLNNQLIFGGLVGLILNLAMLFFGGGN
jgi:hypothetical protein